jgi:ribonuclease VapC
VIAVDTSAIVAILARETEALRVRATLKASNAALISTGNLLELQLVVGGHRAIAAWKEVEVVLKEYRITPRAFDERQLVIAREASVRYGKGRHKAGLNFGDCFAYALARSEDVPLLCTGKDFAATDVELA